MSSYASVTTDSNISRISNAFMQYALQMKHYEECLDTLLICIIGKYPETAKKALKILMQFSTPYLHKLKFLTLCCVHIITVAMET